MRAIAESYSHGLPEPQSAEHFRVDSVPPGQNVHFTGPGQWLPGVRSTLCRAFGLVLAARSTATSGAGRC